jgi:hypothetical protein
MLMTAKRYAYWGACNVRNCLCCNLRIKVGERFVVVRKLGIRHEDACPRVAARLHELQRASEGVFAPTNATTEAVQTLAADLIYDLQYGGYDVLAHYKLQRHGARDFVWIEEGVSAALERAGLPQSLYREAVGLVFQWLQDAHGIPPPRWFVTNTPMGGDDMSMNDNVRVKLHDGFDGLQAEGEGCTVTAAGYGFAIMPDHREWALVLQSTGRQDGRTSWLVALTDCDGLVRWRTGLDMWEHAAAAAAAAMHDLTVDAHWVLPLLAEVVRA